MAEAVVQNGVPVTAGWFVLNVCDARWLHNRMRSVCRFGGEGEAHFDDLGVSLFWLQPGQAMSLYHHEAGQEDFVVLAGRCTLVIEGQQRPLHAWDFVHCPPRTAHTIVAAGDVSALVFAVGARKEKGSARYPVDPVAVAHGAGIPDESTTAQDLYGSFGDPTPGPAPEIFSNPREDILPL
jgi:uncharacterized cupin superfamily protein